MFIDTYVIHKEIKAERNFVHESVEAFLNLVDANQGKRELFIVPEPLMQTWRIILWRTIQKMCKKVIVVEETKYHPDFEFIYFEDWRKSVKMYDIFIVNAPLSMEDYKSGALRELRESVARGDKWVIAANGVKIT